MSEERVRWMAQQPPRSHTWIFMPDHVSTVVELYYHRYLAGQGGSLSPPINIDTLEGPISVEIDFLLMQQRSRTNGVRRAVLRVVTGLANID